MYLPKVVCTKAAVGHNTPLNVVPDNVPMISMGTPITDIKSSLIIKFINTKFCSVLVAY